MKMKKQRTIWMDNEDFNNLKMKANKHFQGKGYLERYLELIARERVVIIKGDGKITITAE